MVAAQNGCYAVAERLIALGADINQKDGRGWTALDYARARGRGKQNGLDRLLSAPIETVREPQVMTIGKTDRKTTIMGMPARRFAWAVLVLAFALAYLIMAVYLRERTFSGRAGDNPLRWISFALLVGAGAITFLLSALREPHDDPYGAGAMGRALAMLISSGFAIGYGVLGLWLLNSPIGYYGSAVLVAGLPLLTLLF